MLKNGNSLTSKRTINHEKGDENSSKLKKDRDVKRRSSVSAKVVGLRIKVYRNGDVFFKGINVVVNVKQISNVQAFMDVLSEKIGLIHGAKRLYTLNGELVKSLDQLQNDKEYVAASHAFTPLPYGHAKLIKTSNELVSVAKDGNTKMIKGPVRVSRSVDFRKQKAKDEKRSESLARSGKENVSKKTFSNDVSSVRLRKKIRKKSVDNNEKHKSSVASDPAKAVQSASSVVSPISTPTSSTSMPTSITAKHSKGKKKNVSLDRNSSVTLKTPAALSPTYTSKTKQLINERVPTPVPVAKVRDSDSDADDDGDGDSNYNDNNTDESSKSIVKSQSNGPNNYDHDGNDDHHQQHHPSISEKKRR